MQQHPKGNFSNHACQCRAQARVDTCTEGKMWVGGPTEIEKIRVHKALGVAIRSSKKTHHSLPRFDDVPVELDSLSGNPRRKLNRGVVAKQFINSASEQCRLSGESSQFPRMPQKRKHTISNKIHDWFVTADDEETAKRHEFLWRHGARLFGGPKKGRSEVILRILTPIRHELGKMALERRRRGLAALLRFRRSERIEVDRCQLHPSPEALQIISREAEQICKEACRQRSGQIGEDVHLTAITTPIENLADRYHHLRSDLLDPLACEYLDHRPSQASVVGRVGIEHRPGQLFAPPTNGLPTFCREPRVPQDGHAILVTGEKPDSRVGVELDRISLPKHCIGWIWIGSDQGRIRVVDNGPTLRTINIGHDSAPLHEPFVCAG